MSQSYVCPVSKKRSVFAECRVGVIGSPVQRAGCPGARAGYSGRGSPLSSHIFTVWHAHSRVRRSPPHSRYFPTLPLHPQSLVPHPTLVASFHPRYTPTQLLPPRTAAAFPSRRCLPPPLPRPHPQSKAAADPPQHPPPATDSPPSGRPHPRQRRCHRPPAGTATSGGGGRKRRGQRQQRIWPSVAGAALAVGAATKGGGGGSDGGKGSGWRSAIRKEAASVGGGGGQRRRQLAARAAAATAAAPAARAAAGSGGASRRPGRRERRRRRQQRGARPGAGAAPVGGWRSAAGAAAGGGPAAGRCLQLVWKMGLRHDGARLLGVCDPSEHAGARCLTLSCDAHIHRTTTVTSRQAISRNVTDGGTPRQAPLCSATRSLGRLGTDDLIGRLIVIEHSSAQYADCCRLPAGTVSNETSRRPSGLTDAFKRSISNCMAWPGRCRPRGP